MFFNKTGVSLFRKTSRHPSGSDLQKRYIRPIFHPLKKCAKCKVVVNQKESTDLACHFGLNAYYHFLPQYRSGFKSFDVFAVGRLGCCIGDKGYWEGSIGLGNEYFFYSHLGISAEVSWEVKQNRNGPQRNKKNATNVSRTIFYLYLCTHNCRLLWYANSHMRNRETVCPLMRPTHYRSFHQQSDSGFLTKEL